MALVDRNGRPRLQRSVRRGGRVTTVYVAAGAEALILEAADREARALRDAQRAEGREPDELERALERIAAAAHEEARLALEAAGYRRHHRGEWRRRRERTDQGRRDDGRTPGPDRAP